MTFGVCRKSGGAVWPPALDVELFLSVFGGDWRWKVEQDELGNGLPFNRHDRHPQCKVAVKRSGAAGRKILKVALLDKADGLLRSADRIDRHLGAPDLLQRGLDAEGLLFIVCVPSRDVLRFG